MFSYIRWFAGVSFVAVLLIALFVGHLFKSKASEDLRSVVEGNNIALAQGFINTTWNMQCVKLPIRPSHDQVQAFADMMKNDNVAMQACLDKVKAGQEVTSHCTELVDSGGFEMKTFAGWYSRFRTSSVPYSQWFNYRGWHEMIAAFDDFSRRVFQHFEDMPIVEISIYSTDGLRLISTNLHGTSGQLSDHLPQVAREDGTFAKALSGQPGSTALEGQEFMKADGTTTRGVLIKSMIPIMRDNNFVPIVSNFNQIGTDKDISCVGTADKNCVDAIIEIRYDVTDQWKQLTLFQQFGTFGVIGIFVLVLCFLLLVSNWAESTIARQHETNIELAAQAAAAQSENRDKSQFLANISHELRTPLNAIIGFSEFIKSERSGPIGNEKYAEYIRDIHSSGVHLLSLINDILDYSKAEADKLELDISEVDATKAVQNCMRLVSPRAETAQVQLIEEIPDDHFVIKTDAKKFKQIMLNLLSNSVKFTPAGGSVTVLMWHNVVDGSLIIEVRDTGIGIAPKDIARALAPFGQVDNTLSRKYEGTGLGLPLTRKFVEIMDGTFNIQSEVGKGTVITITLPKESKGRAAPPDATAES